MILKGDRVTIKPEWQDPGDSEIEFVAMEDEDGGRVAIKARLGLAIDPVQVVNVDMLETAMCQNTTDSRDSQGR